MSTNPIPPIPAVVPGGDPDNPDLVDNPDQDRPGVGTPPGGDSPLTQPVENPEDEDPNEQLPRQ